MAAKKSLHQPTKPTCFTGLRFKQVGAAWSLCNYLQGVCLSAPIVYRKMACCISTSAHATLYRRHMGLTEIANVFARCKAEGRPALMPYWPLGYPDSDTSLRVIEAIVRAGADMLELGVPFSDPLADGPVIQHASQVALEHGASVRKCIELASQLRARGIQVPMLAMGYLNPLIAFGEGKYVQAWHAAGADGFIVPDLPPEESTTLAATCATYRLALIQFTAPTSTQRRVELATTCATG